MADKNLALKEGDSGKFRLVTRSDFDGLVCAVLLRELDVIDDIKFVHPKDVQDGLVLLSDEDITANLPFDPRCNDPLTTTPASWCVWMRCPTIM